MYKLGARRGMRADTGNHPGMSRVRQRNLFGNSVVLPELPRYYLLSGSCKF